MTPEEKAKELVEKFRIHCYCYLGSGMLTNDYDEGVQISNAKQCAIIAVDDIILELKDVQFNNDIELGVDISYLESVKQEIEKL